MSIGRKRCLIGLAAAAVFAGAFSVGSGLGKAVNNIRLRGSYEESQVIWRQELAAGSDEAQVRDSRNRQVAENMHHVSINRVLHFTEGETEADIAVEKGSDFGWTVTIIRDATGERLYRSGVIDPGHYIRKIRLDSPLKKGYYPCTAVWSCYAEGDEYVGEIAWKVVVTIGE